MSPGGGGYPGPAGGPPPPQGGKQKNIIFIILQNVKIFMFLEPGGPGPGDPMYPMMKPSSGGPMGGVCNLLAVILTCCSFITHMLLLSILWKGAFS